MPRKLALLRKPALLGVVVAVAVLVLIDCGAAPPKIGPQGVDQLTVPTPAPDPADFVTTVDNPWLPLAAGSTWEYDVSGDETVETVEAKVAPGPVIAGVRTTGLTRTARGADGTEVESSTSWLAQDAEGNVWLFGHRDGEGDSEGDGSWKAGEDGARAGLAMPARPRVGDGFATGAAASGFVEVGTVLSLDVQVQVLSDSEDEALEIEYRNRLAAATTRRTTYVAGVGPVRESTSPGGRVLVLSGHATG